MTSNREMILKSFETYQASRRRRAIFGYTTLAVMMIATWAVFL